MANEPLTRAVNSTDLEQQQHLVDVDRVAAMASGNRLGSLLWRFGPGVQPAWGRTIVLILARRVVRRHRIGYALARRVAGCALLEHSRPQCMTCNGARELLGANLRVTCPDCGGTGLQRYSDAARRAQIGTYGARIDAAMLGCHSWMADALGSFLAATAGKLGGRDE